MKRTRSACMVAAAVITLALFSCAGRSIAPLPIDPIQAALQLEIEHYQNRLDSTIANLESQGAQFGIDAMDQFQMIDPLAKEELILAWASILDYMGRLDQIEYPNNSVYKHLTGDIQFDEFITYYMAFLVKSSRAVNFINIVDRNEALTTILDEAHPDYGLPPNTYSQFKSHFLHARQAVEYGALKVMYRDQRPEINPYYTRIAMLEGYNSSLGKDYGVKLSVQHAQDVIANQSYSWWYPFQKDIATWAGNTRVYRGDKYLITPENVKEIQTQIQPGDIFFQRREWNMTNAGIPGYWTHAAFYVGSSDEREIFFADDSVQAWVMRKGIASGSFEELLKETYPEAYLSNTRLKDSLQMQTVLEAISPGVVFQTLEKSIYCDGLGVVRPQFSKQEKAQSIYNAFQYFGRGYDYNFDFLTDSTLVCSELIYKAFYPTEGFRGLPIRTAKVAGRLMTPGNLMVKQFDQEYDTMGLDFVLFYDGDELAGVSRPSDLESFRSSWKRWGVFVLIPPELKNSSSPKSIELKE